MANIKSSKKRIRQTARRTAVNITRIGRMRTSVKKVENAIENGEKDVALAAFRDAEPEMMRNAKRNLMHRNTVARKISRLSAKIKAMEA